MKKFTAALFVFLALYSLSHAKIEPQLQSKLVRLSSSEEISVIVYMKEKPGVSALSGTRGDKISALNNFSERSQRGISELLTRKKQRGNKISFNRFWTFNGLGLKAPKDVIEEIAARDDVEKVVLNRTLRFPPRPKETTGLSSIKPLSTAVEDNISQIRADKVWDELNFRGTGVKVGIVDTGVLSSHADLAGKILLEASFDFGTGNKTADTAPDTYGHGTYVSGIVAGGNASGSYIGVAPDATLLVAKSDNGAPIPEASHNSVIGSTEWLIENGARVISMSLGDEPGDAVQIFKEHVDIWNNDFNVLIVAAIGNGGPGRGTSSSPGNVPNALGIGAVDGSDVIADFSSRGPIVWDTISYFKPDVCAPGVSIKSSFNDGGYLNASGTSVACPHAAGVAALLLEASPELTPSEIRNRIKATAFRKDGISHPNNDYGWGRVDAFAAISSSHPTIETPSYSPFPAVYGESVLVSANIYFAIEDSSSARLFFRNDTGAWDSVPMAKLAGTDIYSGTIPGSKMISAVDYYIEAIDGGGKDSLSDTYNIPLDPAARLMISGVQSVPNPFAAGRENATFFYELSKAAMVTVRIMNIRGETVKVLTHSGSFGTNSFEWNGLLEDGRTAANGVYIYHILAKDISGASASTRGKMIVLK